LVLVICVIGIGVIAVAQAHTVLSGLVTQHFLAEGRIQLAHGNHKDAISLFEQYLRLRPDNPIGYLELGLALSEECGLRNCPLAIDTLSRGNVMPQHMSELGDFAFDKSNWRAAHIWYWRSLQGEIDPSNVGLHEGLLYRQAVSAALAQSPNTPQYIALAQKHRPYFAAHQISISSTTTLQAKDFAWMTPLWPPNSLSGESLLHNSPDDTGMLWWGQDTGALIFVEKAGSYVIEASLQHKQPAPIEIAIGINRQMTTQFSLTRGNDSWEVVRTEVMLQSGYQLVSLRLANDGFVKGMDRNGVMKWVKITPK
jgi:tetratricopeptide (TPR) repeat protein